MLLEAAADKSNFMTTEISGEIDSPNGAVSFLRTIRRQPATDDGSKVLTSGSNQSRLQCAGAKPGTKDGNNEQLSFGTQFDEDFVGSSSYAFDRPQTRAERLNPPTAVSGTDVASVRRSSSSNGDDGNQGTSGIASDDAIRESDFSVCSSSLPVVNSTDRDTASIVKTATINDRAVSAEAGAAGSDAAIEVAGKPTSPRMTKQTAANFQTVDDYAERYERIPDSVWSEFTETFRVIEMAVSEGLRCSLDGHHLLHHPSSSVTGLHRQQLQQQQQTPSPPPPHQSSVLNGQQEDVEDLEAAAAVESPTTAACCGSGGSGGRTRRSDDFSTAAASASVLVRRTQHDCVGSAATGPDGITSRPFEGCGGHGGSRCAVQARRAEIDVTVAAMGRRNVFAAGGGFDEKAVRYSVRYDRWISVARQPVGCTVKDDVVDRRDAGNCCASSAASASCNRYATVAGVYSPQQQQQHQCTPVYYDRTTPIKCYDDVDVDLSGGRGCCRQLDSSGGRFVGGCIAAAARRLLPPTPSGAILADVGSPGLPLHSGSSKIKSEPPHHQLQADGERYDSAMATVPWCGAASVASPSTTGDWTTYNNGHLSWPAAHHHHHHHYGYHRHNLHQTVAMRQTPANAMRQCGDVEPSAAANLMTNQRLDAGDYGCWTTDSSLSVKRERPPSSSVSASFWSADPGCVATSSPMNSHHRGSINGSATFPVTAAVDGECTSTPFQSTAALMKSDSTTEPNYFRAAPSSYGPASQDPNAIRSFGASCRDSNKLADCRFAESDNKVREESNFTCRQMVELSHSDEHYDNITI